MDDWLAGRDCWKAGDATRLGVFEGLDANIPIVSPVVGEVLVSCPRLMLPP